MKEHMDLFKEKILKLSGIENISYSSRIPGNYWGSWCCVNIEGHENKYFNNYVDADYLRMMGIKLAEGRDFSAESQADLKTTYLINQFAVKQYNLNDPIGQVITPGNGVKGTIIVIIKDFHYRGLNYEMTPLILFYTSGYLNYVNIRITPGNITGKLQQIMGVWKEICPAFAFEYKFLNDSYDMQYRSERKFENLLFSFALFALFIASIGLYGLSKFSAQRKTKEIGIRKVTGSSILEIMLMQNMDYLRWVFIALVLSCPLAIYSMKKWLTGFAYRTEIQWWIFVLGGLIALLIAAMSISMVSWRAAKRNPVEALRYE
jgi:putative ABC transport system permease protein